MIYENILLYLWSDSFTLTKENVLKHKLEKHFTTPCIHCYLSNLTVSQCHLTGKCGISGARLEDSLLNAAYTFFLYNFLFFFF